jgi:hypothetical protein
MKDCAEVLASAGWQVIRSHRHDAGAIHECRSPDDGELVVVHEAGSHLIVSLRKSVSTALPRSPGIRASRDEMAVLGWLAQLTPDDVRIRLHRDGDIARWVSLSLFVATEDGATGCRAALAQLRRLAAAIPARWSDVDEVVREVAEGTGLTLGTAVERSVMAGADAASDSADPDASAKGSAEG